MSFELESKSHEYKKTKTRDVLGGKPIAVTCTLYMELRVLCTAVLVVVAVQLYVQ